MNYVKKVEIYNRSISEIQSELATFFLMNNFKVEIESENKMRVETLYPRFDIKRPPAAEIKSAEFTFAPSTDFVIVEANAEMLKVHKMLKSRKRFIYTILTALIIVDLLYTSGSFFISQMDYKMIIDIAMVLSFIPLMFLILRYHFFKIYQSKHHNDLDRIMENLQYK